MNDDYDDDNYVAPEPTTKTFSITVETYNAGMSPRQRTAVAGMIEHAMNTLYVKLQLAVPDARLAKVYLDISSPQSGTTRVNPQEQD